VGAFSSTARGQISVILDATGDGKGHVLKGPLGPAVDAKGNVYVLGMFSHNVFRITPSGEVRQILDGSGDGQGNELVKPRDLAVDAKGNVYVLGQKSRNVFKVTPAGQVSQIFAHSEKGEQRYRFTRPTRITTGREGNVYVSSQTSANVLRITPAGEITEIIDVTGDGQGHELRRPNGLATDAEGNLYVVGARTRNVFKITPAGEITQIVDRNGAGRGQGLVYPNGVAVDGAGNVYVIANNSGNLLRIAPDGKIVQLMGPTLDGVVLGSCLAVAVTAEGTVFLSRSGTHAAWRVARDGSPTKILDASGAGGGKSVKTARGIAVDGQGRVYVAGFGSDNVFRIVPPPSGAERWGTPQPEAEKQPEGAPKPAEPPAAERRGRAPQGRAGSPGPLPDPGGFEPAQLRAGSASSRGWTKWLRSAAGAW
jgi:sugar lactone lactonase YvrE